MTRRIGILGGTFDPIHCGHRDLAVAAESALGLTSILVVPSSVPPHRAQPFASSFHRFAMVALAVAEHDRWRASDLELRSEPPSYTADTLRRLHADGYDSTELFFLIGADAFADIPSWKDYPGLLDAAHFVVIGRAGAPVSNLPRLLPALAARMRPATRTPSPSGTWIFLLDAATADVSSTAIRQHRADGLAIAGLVVPRVQQHIEQHGLYAPDHAARSVRGGTTGIAASRLHGEK